MNFKLNIQWIRFSFLAMLIVFSLFTAFKAEAYPPENVSVSVSPATVNSSTVISIVNEHYLGSIASWCVEINFGDGSPTKNGNCSPSDREIRCNVNFSHTYSNAGSYNVSAVSCNCSRPSDCKSASATLTVSSAAPSPVCGNGTLETGEGCDDGNIVSGDGCDSSWQTEGGGSTISPGWILPPGKKRSMRPLPMPKATAGAKG